MDIYNFVVPNPWHVCLISNCFSLLSIEVLNWSQFIVLNFQIFYQILSILKTCFLNVIFFNYLE